jgi:Zn-dependent peptidase ImmA (M78 family)
LKELITKLIQRHKTNDPFEIASQKNILVLTGENLGGILGYFKTHKRIKMIHINRELDEIQQKYVCAHELGHALLHPKESTPFLKRNTFVVTDKIENEANTFAVELLIPDRLLYEYRDTRATIQEVAATYGVPKEFAHFKRLDNKKKEGQ